MFSFVFETHPRNAFPAECPRSGFWNDSHSSLPINLLTLMFSQPPVKCFVRSFVFQWIYTLCRQHTCFLVGCWLIFHHRSEPYLSKTNFCTFSKSWFCCRFLPGGVHGTPLAAPERFACRPGSFVAAASPRPAHPSFPPAPAASCPHLALALHGT